MTGYSFTTPVWQGAWVTPVVAEVVAAPKANGPEDQPQKQDAPAGWDQIGWREHEGQVRRLRQRIFKAAQEQDWPRVRNLQKLMLRSRANTLVSVRQVTQRNAGRRTAGIDGEVALTPDARARVAVRVHRSGACIYRRHQTVRSCGRSGFPCCWTGAIRRGSAMRWSPSGRPGSSPHPTGSGRAEAATTRSAPSTTSARGQRPSAHGRWTRTWPRRSTASTTLTF